MMTSPFREIQLFTLLTPAVALIFATALFIAWHHFRQQRYILILSLSFVAFAIGSLAQILQIPYHYGLNTILTAIIYTASALGVIEACLARLKRRSGLRFTLPIAIVMLALIVHYFYVDENLLARIYVLNFGYGILFVMAAILMGVPRGRNATDTILFWVIIAFGIQFFVRTGMTAHAGIAALDVSGFAISIFWVALNIAMVLFGVLLGLTFLTAIVGDVIRSLNSESETDPLTGAINRRGFDRLAASYLADPRRRPVSLVLCDIDRFKRINDAHGHPFGDAVLVEIRHILSMSVRADDVVARLGGEEFAILLPDADLRSAHELAERLRRAIEASRFGGIAVTASFGVAECLPPESLASLTLRADALLYAAKRQGRNRTISDQSEIEAADQPIDLAARRRTAGHPTPETGT